MGSDITKLTKRLLSDPCNEKHGTELRSRVATGAFGTFGVAAAAGPPIAPLARVCSGSRQAFLIHHSLGFQV